MSGSCFGNIFRISTWGESHGAGLGVVVDGCPAGLDLSEEDVQVFLDRRKPGQSKFTTKRAESDKVRIMSGVFEGKTTGTPISMMILNEDQRSRDYGDIASYYRPGHADFTFDEKYGFRDYRGGGRSSGRETAARVAAGAVASKILAELGIEVYAYTSSIADISIDENNFDKEERDNNALYMPDKEAFKKADAYLSDLITKLDSAGGTVSCIVKGMPTGVGEPVFDKLDAKLSQALFSIGAVKAVEIGAGTNAAMMKGSEDNDGFAMKDGKVTMTSNNAGGILGGMSNGADILLKATFKATPSIAKEQKTVNKSGEDITISIKGRHDPVIVPRAVVVVESMTAITLLDELLINMTARLDKIKTFYN